MKHQHEVIIKRTFDYLKISNDSLLDIIERNEHIDSAKVKITEAIEELGLGYSELKNKYKWDRGLDRYVIKDGKE